MRGNITARIDKQERVRKRLPLRLGRLTFIALASVATIALPSIAGANGAPEKKLTSPEWREDLECMVRTLLDP